jgi:hypothetical protein
MNLRTFGPEGADDREADPRCSSRHEDAQIGDTEIHGSLLRIFLFWHPIFARADVDARIGRMPL